MSISPDPHGQAALMLCESLIVLMVERGLIGKPGVIEAIEAVVAVKHEIAGESESVVVSMASIGLLRRVAQSVAAATAPVGELSPAPVGP